MGVWGGASGLTYNGSQLAEKAWASDNQVPAQEKPTLNKQEAQAPFLFSFFHN